MIAVYRHIILLTLPKKDRKFCRTIKQITGVSPGNLALYKLAVVHPSAAREVSRGVKNSYERLEYLGDAMLGAVVAEFLFKKFPYKNEGFLTDIRSRIVNRESLNKVGKKIGLQLVVQFNGSHTRIFKSLYGDVLEALIGAVYMDKGFETCKKFIVNHILEPHYDIDEVINNTQNFKSVLLEWAQKNTKEMEFRIVGEKGNVHNKEFLAEVWMDEQCIGAGAGSSKKKAEQSAAEKACVGLGLK